MRTLATIALFCLFTSQVFGQSNSICNFHFENVDEGKTPPFPTWMSQVEKMECWEHNAPAGNSSPDWYHTSNFYIEEDFGSGFQIVNGAEGTMGYVGFLASEPIYGDLIYPMLKNELYAFALKIRLIHHDHHLIEGGTPVMTPNYLENAFEEFALNPARGVITIEISFSKNKLEYGSSAGCKFGDYKHKGAGIAGQQIITKTIDLANYQTGEWHQIEFDPFISKNDWEFIAVQTRKEEAGEVPCNHESYLLIDELQLRNPCQNENDAACKFTEGSLYDAGVGVSSNTQDNRITLTNIDNANFISVELTDLNGQAVVYQNNYTCNNGWVNDLELDLDEPSPGSLATTSYNLTYTVMNDLEICRKTEPIYWQDFDNLPTQPCQCRDEGVINDCCFPIYSAEQYYPNTGCFPVNIYSVSAIDELYMGVVSQYHVYPSTHVDFVASDRIIFGNQFSSSGTMTAEVKPCTSSNKMESLNEEKEYNNIDEISEIFSFYPNPSSGNTMFINHAFQDASIDIFSIAGQHLANFNLEAESRESFNLSNLSNGVHLIHYSNGTEFSAKRLEITK